MGRFINADGQSDPGACILGHNIFVYCGNNPVNNLDSTGCGFFSAIGDTIKNVFNAIVNVAIDETAAQTGNYYFANQIGEQLKIGDKKTTANTQQVINEISKYEVTIGVSSSVGIPYADKVPILNIISPTIQAGFGSTTSLERGSKNYAFIGANIGKSISDIPRFSEYFLPFGLAFEFDMRKTGSVPYILPGWSQGVGVDTFMGANALSSDIGISYGGNYYWVWDRK